MAGMPEQRIQECLERWQLAVVRRLPSDWSYVAEVRRPDGSPAVLKLPLEPEREVELEAEGLRRWNGNGAVRLYDFDQARAALLEELAEPGSQLWELDEDEGVRIACGLLPRLWRPVEDGHPFDTVLDVASTWGVEARELAESQGEQVLLHRDFHRGNVLAATREHWLVIDPKPIVGEREFDAAWLVGDEVHDARRRLDLVASELDLDRERLRRWGVVRYAAGTQGAAEPGWPGGTGEMRRIAEAIRSA